MENSRAPKDGDSNRRAPERRKPGNGGGGSAGAPTPPWSLLFLIAAMVLVFLMWNPFKAEIRVSYYPWFLEQVDTDNIESITFQGREASGKLRTPDKDYKASPSATAQTVTHFVTTIPTEDALDRVLNALQGDAVPATGEPRKTPPNVVVLEPSAPTTLLWVSFLLPMVLIGGLIFFMMRPNILPADDIGLQRAMSLHYNDGKPLSKLKIRQIANEWQPWRTVATWYLWRSLDPIPAN